MLDGFEFPSQFDLVDEVLEVLHEDTEDFLIFLQDVGLEDSPIILRYQSLQLQLHDQVQGVLLLQGEGVGGADFLYYVVILSHDDWNLVLVVQHLLWWVLHSLELSDFVVVFPPELFFLAPHCLRPH